MRLRKKKTFLTTRGTRGRGMMIGCRVGHSAVETGGGGGCTNRNAIAGKVMQRLVRIVGG